ncbi:MAG: TRAP transporter large permease [Firmicutes bacterium]|nr:TRAP transporter large permease [Bacillota bacterium]
MGFLLFGALFALILLGMPVAMSIGLSSVIVLAIQEVPLVLLPQRMFAGTDSFPLVAVPFFILAGDLLAKGNVSKRLVDFADSFLGTIRGGLSLVSVLGAMFFAAISGSGAATTAAIAAPMIPEMKEKGYDPAFSAALIAAAGTIGVVIPPSVPMVLYAIVADQSVAKLFLGGFIPGALMGISLMAVALRTAAVKCYPKGSKFAVSNVWAKFKGSIWGLLTPGIILGGIFSGYFTPSEAAVIAVDYALIVALFVYRDLKPRDIFRIIVDSGVTMSLVMFVIATSNLFSWILSNYQIPQAVAEAVLAMTQNRFLILFLINIVILIAGVFMETASALIILTPVFLPIVRNLGVNLVHFGIIMVIGLAIGMITPPVAINLYVASTVSGLSIERISKAVIPMLLALIGVLMVFTFVPLLFA